MKYTKDMHRRHLDDTHEGVDPEVVELLKGIDNHVQGGGIIYRYHKEAFARDHALRKAQLVEEAKPRKHVLLTPDTCTCNGKHDGDCPVCDWHLAVCANCGRAESQLDQPCTGGVER